MANRIAIAVFALLFSGGAWAWSCPSVMAEIDQALEGGSEAVSQLGDDVLADVRTLRQQGEEHHNAGNHDASMDALTQAADLLGIDTGEGHQ